MVIPDSTAAIDSNVDLSLLDLPPSLLRALAWAVREEATNVVGHNDARTCSITARRGDGMVELEIVNDGARGRGEWGYGLTACRASPRAVRHTDCGPHRRWRIPTRRPNPGGGQMIRVLIAEDMHMLRGALVALLSLEEDMKIVAELDRGDRIVSSALITCPDVAVLDIDLPGLDGLSAAEQLHQQVPSCNVLVLTGLSSPGYLLRALQVHARGFIVKDAPAEKLADGIRRVAKGERVIDPDLVAAALETGSTPLTTREVDVLRAVESGNSTEQVAKELALSPTTVRNYMSNAISKVGGRNRIDAIRIARNAGWL